LFPQQQQPPPRPQQMQARMEQAGMQPGMPPGTAPPQSYDISPPSFQTFSKLLKIFPSGMQPGMQMQPGNNNQMLQHIIAQQQMQQVGHYF